jgi:hypothetical protein
MCIMRRFVRPFLEERELGSITPILDHLARNTAVLDTRQRYQVMQVLAEIVGLLR